MKTLTTLLLLVLVSAIFRPAAAQKRVVAAPLLPADSLTHRIKFSGVGAVAGVPAVELQARAREWVALTFQNARQVTQLDDAARGVLIVRGYTNAWVDRVLRPDDNAGQLSFTLRLDFRDGRYRYEVFDLGQPNSFSIPTTITSFSGYGLTELAALLLSASATVEASPGQRLLQPNPNTFPAANDLAGEYRRRWPAYAQTVQQTVVGLLESLQQHAAAGPKKW